MQTWLSPCELPFAEQVLVQNVSHENHLIFMRMTVQVAYIFILIVHTNSRFATEATVNLGLGYSSMSCSGSLWFVCGLVIHARHVHSLCTALFLLVGRNAWQAEERLRGSDTLRDNRLLTFLNYVLFVKVFFCNLCLSALFPCVADCKSCYRTTGVGFLVLSRFRNIWFFISFEIE